MTESNSIAKIAALSAQIEAEHLAALGSARSAIAHAVRCGQLLIEAKAAVPHGEWLAWILGNLSFGARQAQKYSRLAKHADTRANATCEFASIDQALTAMRCGCSTLVDEKDLNDEPPTPPTPAGTIGLDARRRFAQKRAKALGQLTSNLEKTAARYGERTVEAALKGYRDPPHPSSATLLKNIGNLRARLMASPMPKIVQPTAAETPALRALALLEQADGAVEADGAFSATVRDQLATLIAGVRAELSARSVNAASELSGPGT